MSTSTALGLKATAQVMFTGNELGGSFSIQVPDIGLEGSSTAPLSPNLKSGVQTATGTLSYTSINQIESAQTFVTADYDSGRVTMIFSIQNAIVGIFTATKGVSFTSAFAPTATWVKFTAYTNNKDALLILQGIEQLGGAEGYEEYLTGLSSASRALTVTSNADSFAAADNWDTTGIAVSFGAAVVYSWFSALTTDGHKGSGHSWGIGAGCGNVAGVLHFSSWDKLKSAKNDFHVAAWGEGGGGMAFYFSIDGEPVAWIGAAGIVIGGLIGVNGTWEWS